MDTSNMNPPKSANTPTWAKIETLDKTNSLLILGKPKGTWDEGVYLAHEYISGWYSSPDLKVSSTPRQSGNGNFGHREQDILYESRTVIANIICQGGRKLAVDYAQWLSEFLGKMVRFTVHDYDHETWVTGYCSLTFDSAHYEDAIPGTVTVVCDDPRRYGSEIHTVYAYAASGGSGGLQYEADSPQGLIFPLNYGNVSVASTTCSLQNNGASYMYPTIRYYGNGRDCRILMSNGQEVRYRGLGGQPVLFDCLNHSATINGVDVTRYVSCRQWPKIAPNSEMVFSIVSDSGDYLQITGFDTYL